MDKSPFVQVASWHELNSRIDNRLSIYYHAPLDTAPRPVFPRKRFKNGKIRFDSGEVVFTADQEHLSRFYRRA